MFLVCFLWPICISYIRNFKKTERRNHILLFMKAPELKGNRITEGVKYQSVENHMYKGVQALRDNISMSVNPKQSKLTN